MSLTQRNQAFLTDLFAGSFRGHGIIMTHPLIPAEHGDFLVSDRPVREWLPWVVANYQTKVQWLERIGDDSVPYVNLATNTGVFASAFGCPFHVYGGMATNACARPIVHTVEEADALPEPDLSTPAFVRFFELARLAREELGPDVPIGVPDIQSPFDIAALVWDKEQMFYAMVDEPDAVQRLVAKCHRLLTHFFTVFLREFPNANLAHYPPAWAPPALGVWLSEDEAGALSREMFSEFCLPSLVAFSEQFGGLFMHSCAAVDHQYPEFKRIPNLRGLNRFFQASGPRPAIQTFSGGPVFLQVTEEKGVDEYLDIALPSTRYLFCVSASNLEDAERIFARLRERCPKIDLIADVSR